MHMTHPVLSLRTLCLGVLLLSGLGHAEEAVPLMAGYAMDGKDGVIRGDGQMAPPAELKDGAAVVDGGRDGTALKLKGGKSHALLAKSSQLDRLTRAFSVSLWVKPESYHDGDWAYILTKRPGWWTSKPFSIEMGRDGTLNATYYDGKYRGIRGGRLKKKEWSHVALVFAAGDRIELYVNGKKAASKQNPGKLQGNAEAFAVGYEQGGDFPGGNYKGFSGLVDELRFYPVALSEAQIAQDMKGELKTRPATMEDLPKRGMTKDDIPEAVRAAPAPGAPLEASIVFDKEPVAQGMWFEHRSVKPATVKGEKKEQQAWVAKQGSTPGMPWGRSFFFTLTDPRFKDGRMPVVDIEIEYRLPGWSGVNLFADTADGSVQVGTGWGGSKAWKTLKCRVNNAHFGARDFNNPANEWTSDGYDLRFNGTTSDLAVRSIKVTGYDLADDPEYKRLLELQSIDTANVIYLFRKDQEETLHYKFFNLAKKDLEATYQYTVKTFSGETLATGSGDFSATGRANAEFVVPVNTGGLRHDVYDVQATLVQDRGGKPHKIFNKTIRFGVTSDAKIEKSAEGEYLYGLSGVAWNNEVSLTWAKALGVDAIRHGFEHKQYDMKGLEKGMPVFDRENLKVMYMTMPSWHDKKEERDKKYAAECAFAEEAARRFPQIRYWEIGNEPDLPFFYKGPIETYARQYEAMYRAIKKGNPDTVVMNGGLSFFGKEGGPRSRRFVEVVDADAIDAWAFHAHGDGADAERMAFERMRKTVDRYGQPHKIYIDTESGTASASRKREPIHAATVIQKMVYANAAGIKAFFLFKIGGENDMDFDIARHKNCRPPALAYRTMTEHLKGCRPARRLKTEDIVEELYLFEEVDGPGRVVVGWMNNAALKSNVYLDIAASSEDAKRLTLLDAYGNEMPVDMLPDGSVPVPLAYLPVFLKWTATDPAYGVTVVPGVIDAPAQATFVTGTSDTLAVKVRNPFPGAVDLNLGVEVDSRVAVNGPERIPVSLAVGETKTVALPMTIGESGAALPWPEKWRVFLDVDDKQADMATLKPDTETLPGTDGPASARIVFPKEGRVDLGELAGGYKEKRLAVVTATIESPAEQTVRVGAYGDYWMGWWVNGAQVYDPWPKANRGGSSVLDHTIELPLRKGSNQIAVKVYSGSQGWHLTLAGPAKLRALSGEGDVLRLTLSRADETVATERIGLEFAPPVPAAAGDVMTAPLADWKAQAPAFTIGDEGVTNLFRKFPDQSKWWQGEKDLSMRGWLRADAEWLYVIAAVRDETHNTPGEPSAMWKADSLQIALAPTGEAGFSEYAVGLVGGTATVYKHHAVNDGEGGRVNEDEVRARIERLADEGVTLYRVAIKRSVIGGKPFRLNVLANDDDFGERKQFVEWRPGLGEKKNPSAWMRLALSK